MTHILNIFTTRLRKEAAQLPYLPRTLGLVWDASRGWTTLWTTLLIVQGLLPIATVYLSRAVVDSLVMALRARGSWPSIQPVLVFCGMVASIMLLGELLRSLTSWIRSVQAELVQDHVTALVHRKSVTADLAFYDSPDFYDHLHRARVDAGERPVALLESLGNLTQNGITMLAMVAVLIPYGIWMPIALLAGTLPSLYVVLHYAGLQYESRMSSTADERRTWYYDWLLTAAENAPELRVFELGDHFESVYQRLRQRLRCRRFKLAKRQSIAELGAGTVALFITGVAMAWMLWKVVRGLLTLGDLALFYQVFQQGLRLISNLFENLGRFYGNSLFLGNLFEFLTLEPQVADTFAPLALPGPPKTGICFRDVSFRYPNSPRAALSNVNLTISAGKMVAILGPNGSGKSTLLKLLCRFYDPQAGEIEIDGVDLRELSLKDLRRMITALFQQPVHFNDSVRENISFGDLASSPNSLEIERAAQAAGSDEIIIGLPHGYSSLLGKAFAEGTELSVGEWQRIALARAFLRRAPILILDEPTSAMDPWAEADWLDRFQALSADRTSILITHRFTTAMRADIIHVMSEGQIVESGSHEELLDRGGLYAQSWAAQVGYQPV